MKCRLAEDDAGLRCRDGFRHWLSVKVTKTFSARSATQGRRDHSDVRSFSRNQGFSLAQSARICEQEVCCGDLGSGVVRKMSEVQPSSEKPAAAGASRAAAQAEAPFIPEAASPAERAAGWKNPPSRMQLLLWSGNKRHVFVGMLGISVLATIPWLMLTSGNKHDSHADYMDRAEGARRARLSTASAAVAPPTSS